MFFWKNRIGDAQQADSRKYFCPKEPSSSWPSTCHRSLKGQNLGCEVLMCNSQVMNHIPFFQQWLQKKVLRIPNRTCQDFPSPGSSKCHAPPSCLCQVRGPKSADPNALHFAYGKSTIDRKLCLGNQGFLMFLSISMQIVSRNSVRGPAT